MPTITSVLRKPEVARTLFSSVLARMPYGAMGLLIVLRLTDAQHSYGEAGIAAAAYALALAIASPPLARFVDHDGQTRTLVVTALTGAAATAALALVPSSSSLLLFIVLAALNGALQPPLGGTMRALWDLLLTRPDERHIGYALEASAVEVVFTGGPLVLVGAVAGALGPQAGLLACALLTCGGTIAFALSSASRRWRPTPRTHAPSFFGPLRAAGVRTLLFVSVGAGVMFGSIELAVTAFGREQDQTALIGVMLAIWSIGSLVGGLLIARARAAQDPAQRIAVLLVILGISSAILGLAQSTAALMILLAFAGLAIAPTFATVNGLMGHVVPDGMLTEAFGWATGAVMIGLTVGSPAAGFLVDHVSIQAAFGFSGIPLLITAAVVWRLRATIAVPCAELAAEEAAERVAH